MAHRPVFLRCLAAAALTLAMASPLWNPSALAAPSSATGTLIGTMVLEKGRSFAAFAERDSFWPVREGEEISPGTRLTEVQTDRVVVETAGIRREILLFPTVLPSGLVYADSVRAVVAPEEGASVWVQSLAGRAEKIRNRMERNRRRHQAMTGTEDAEASTPGEGNPL